MGTRYQKGDVVKILDERMKATVVRVERPDTSSPGYVLRREDGREVKEKASNLLKAKNGEDPDETTHTIYIKVGKPVKAGKYFSTAENRFKRAKFKDVYAVGKRRNGGIQHTSDIRDVQAYSSNATFIYADPQLHYTYLKNLVDKIGVSRDESVEKIWLYSGGLTKALKIDQWGTTDLKILADNGEDEGLNVDYYPDMDKESMIINATKSELQ